MLVATRILQGVGGGMLMPIGMAVLYPLTPPERRGAIFGLFGLPIMVGPALGPLLSAYLLQLNGLVPADAVMDAASLPKVQMPNRDGFIVDDRPDTKSVRCMSGTLPRRG